MTHLTSALAGMAGALVVELVLWLVKSKPWRSTIMRGGDLVVPRDPVAGQFSVHVEEPSR